MHVLFVDYRAAGFEEKRRQYREPEKRQCRRSIACVTAPSPIVKNKEQDTPYVLSTKEAYELIDNFIAAVRAKVVVEIIRGIKKALGEDFPVSVRVSAEDMVSDGNQMCNSAAMAQLYEQAGADLINVSNGMNGVGDANHAANAVEAIYTGAVTGLSV